MTSGATILNISLEKNRLTIITVHNELTRLSLFHLKSVMLDHFIAKNATAQCTLGKCLLHTRYFLLHILCPKTHYFRPWHSRRTHI